MKYFLGVTYHRLERMLNLSNSIWYLLIQTVYLKVKLYKTARRVIPELYRCLLDWFRTDYTRKTVKAEREIVKLLKASSATSTCLNKMKVHKLKFRKNNQSNFLKRFRHKIDNSLILVLLLCIRSTATALYLCKTKDIWLLEKKWAKGGVKYLLAKKLAWITSLWNLFKD